MSKAIFVGSFDPWHTGHSDVLANALKIFDTVVVAVADNPAKHNWFNQEERVRLVEKCVAHLGNRVVVKPAGEKTIEELCHEERIFNVFRGIKAGRTLEEELRLQYLTKYMAQKEYNEEIFFCYTVTGQDDFRGSSIIKKQAVKGKDFSDLVPREIVGDIRERAKRYA